MLSVLRATVQLIQENLDNVSCCKMKEKASHQIMEFQISLEGRTVPTMLVLDHISSLKEQPVGPQEKTSLSWFEALFSESNSHRSGHRLGHYIIKP